MYVQYMYVCMYIIYVQYVCMCMLCCICVTRWSFLRWKVHNNWITQVRLCVVLLCLCVRIVLQNPMSLCMSYLVVFCKEGKESNSVSKYLGRHVPGLVSTWVSEYSWIVRTWVSEYSWIVSTWVSEYSWIVSTWVSEYFWIVNTHSLVPTSCYTIESTSDREYLFYLPLRVLTISVQLC